MAEPQICKRCGEEKEFLHGKRCCKILTKRYIDQVYTGLPDEPKPNFERLLRIGMDDVTLAWCKKSLKLSEKTTDSRDRLFILQIIADMITASAKMLEYPQPDGVTYGITCPICSQDVETCRTERTEILDNVKQAINNRIDFGWNEKIASISNLTHFGLDIIIVLVKIFDHARKDEETSFIEISASLIGYLLYEYINEVAFAELMSQVDDAIGW